MDKFFKKWDMNVDKLNDILKDTVIEAASQVYKETVDRTPIGRPELWSNPSVPENYEPGDLRNAWEINWGIGFINATASFSGKLASIEGAANYKLGNDIYIRNQTPYAHAVEYGWSKIQAPRGMMRISVRQYHSFLNTAAKKNKL